MTGRAYVHGRSADTNLAEIHGELLDKQVNVTKREFEKKLPGFIQASTSPRKKCAMKMKYRRKRLPHKNFVVKGKIVFRRMAEPISMNFDILILQTMKVLMLE